MMMMVTCLLIHTHVGERSIVLVICKFVISYELE